MNGLKGHKKYDWSLTDPNKGNNPLMNENFEQHSHKYKKKKGVSLHVERKLTLTLTRSWSACPLKGSKKNSNKEHKPEPQICVVLLLGLARSSWKSWSCAYSADKSVADDDFVDCVKLQQEALKVETMVKLKEEIDYKSLCRRLDIELDKLTMEYERQQKVFEDDIERLTTEAQHRILEAQKNCSDSLEKERLKYQKDYKESFKRLEEKVMENRKKYEDFCMTSTREIAMVPAEELDILKKILHKETFLRTAAEEERNHLKNQMTELKMSEASRVSNIFKLRKMLEDETYQKEKLKGEIARLQSQLLQLGFKVGKTKQQIDGGGFEKDVGGVDSPTFLVEHQQEASGNGEKVSDDKLYEQGGLQKIMSLLEAEDADARISAVKLVANLASEETNQKKIVEAGGLTSLIRLLKNSHDETTQRVAASAIANLAMNETNQDLIVAQGGISLLSMAATNAEDPQSLRMVAGAIANLCGNEKLQIKLKEEGGIKALLGMVKCRHPDVHTQVARGIANFAKCESKACTQGTKVGRSLLIEDGVLPWIVQNANNEVLLVRRHVELALCHLAQHEANARDMISGGAIRELVRISRDCSREDIRILARRTLVSVPAFHAEIRRLGIDY
ncbi:kinesin-like protein KIN-UA [Cajanus cajan]|uniref:kinesin-like protein KIN-UA n=1 Tax=Cajanus cajan TaxID=3821 RepID=UPI0010FB3906|nr:kinesin-like protein KIN-UA [Cajanus cajan]